MTGPVDDLDRVLGLVEARGSVLGRPLFRLATVTSTNDEAHRAAKAGAPHGATWVAERQTAGRGRRGRVWVSPPGEGLLFSTLMRLPCAPAQLPPLALIAGLAVRDAVARAAPNVPISIKWPNDVVARDRKVAGVLVEASSLGSRVEAVIVGIGINVHTRSFPHDIADRATSVALLGEGGPPADRAELLADVLGTLDRDLHVFAARGLRLLRARLEAADALRGRRVRCEGGTEGVAGGIDHDGRLVVRDDRGNIERWMAGEVNLVRG
ncbi:MAG TPA: biotin--[acetyl-CoA-carboxylase] ligase [Polyangiaceae bacterium]|nr:biotin--[acetyl-CoA-carboxylase] ligase [Polyangiaceae bacterium]